ncbi:MAG: DUF1015 domain-containing protein [Treponema sp.]|nr:DUF1015 domain-containing protein [Treponema sp.]
MSCKQRLNTIGIEVPSVILPKTASGAWPVIACDQFTQDRDYWEKAKTAAEGAPSTLNMIIPEVFLSDENISQRISDIHLTMKKYLSDGTLEKPRLGFIYTERDTPYQKKRRGLIAAVDLEQYDWQPNARPLIRSTEGTVAERLPPRMDIRRGAPLELPHVLLLIDDDSAEGNDSDCLLPRLGEFAQKKSPVYDTQLMMDSGSVKGWFIDSENEISFITEKLEELFRRSVTRYNCEKPFLFAVGDGNHSLAAAKGIWEEIKAAYKGEGLPEHPCRYALAEIENIYDPAIQFEPIHRLVFDIDYDGIVSLLSALPGFSCQSFKSAEELAEAVRQPFDGNLFGVICGGRYALVSTNLGGIATASLQPLLDEYAKNDPLLIEYIHDEAEVLRLAVGKNAGILLPPVQKSGLFDTVARLGPLPRKSFSMGHSAEKRFYFECRQLI